MMSIYDTDAQSFVKYIDKAVDDAFDEFMEENLPDFDFDEEQMNIVELEIKGRRLFYKASAFIWYCQYHGVEPERFAEELKPKKLALFMDMMIFDGYIADGAQCEFKIFEAPRNCPMIKVGRTDDYALYVDEQRKYVHIGRY